MEQFPYLFFLVSYLVTFAVPITAVYFIVRFLRAYERRTQALKGGHDNPQSVAALEAQLDQFRIELDQVREEQRFTHQLLTRHDDSPNALNAPAPPRNS